MEKKNIAITVLIIALIGSGVGNIILAIAGQAEVPPSRSLAFIRGTSAGPDTLEIVDAWDSASNDVLEQVVETLFGWDLSDTDLPRINILAETFWWNDTTELQIKLKEDILFHDGTPFNADAAKWNLDRLQYLINATGTNTGEVAHTQSLWMNPDGETPIMSSIASDGAYNITITLSNPYAPFQSALTYINSGMISPTAHAGDATSFIDLTTGDVVGTGPFTYDSFTPDVEVRLSRWDDYWMRDQNGFPVVANFHTVIFAIYDDAVTAHNAFLNYQIDANAMSSDQNLLQYEADPKLHVERFTEDTGIPSLVYQYIGFNNKLYNITWRKAFSYAFNYTYIIEELRLGNAIRSVSPISPGFGASYNASVPAVAVPDNGDIAIARATMQSMGFGVSLTTDAQWIAVAEGPSPFASPVYTYNTGNTYRTDLGIAVANWLKLIGCAVVDNGVEWSVFLTDLFDQMDNLGILMIGRGPDYLEPYNMLDPLFNPISSSNSGQVNDTWLNDKMASVLGETDDTARNNIYKSIQWYMATQGFFHIPLYHTKIAYTHLSEIKGVPYNVMKRFYAYPIYSVAPGPFTLSSDAEDPDPDGNFTLSWTESLGAVNYTVYRHSSYITSINGTLTVLTSGITETNLTINNLFVGTHYFIVEALNASGDTLSNCIEIEVFFIDPNKRSPIFDGLFLNYTFNYNEIMALGVNYSYISGNYYQVNETIPSIFYGLYNINNQTRERSGGSPRVIQGDYTPYWIFSNQSIGDLIYIAVGGVGDHLFNITGETTFNLPGLGDFDAWVLKDLTEPKTHALYDKATGILLNSTFFYYSGTSNYSLTLQASNLFEPPTEPPGEPPKSFILGSTANSPDIDGNFELIWASSEGANNYSIYQHSALITEINGSLTLLSTDYTETTFSCVNYSDGVYYFIIVAYNNFGVNYSNCLRITVLTSPVIPPEIPGYAPLYIIGVIVVSSYLLIRKRKKTN